MRLSWNLVAGLANSACTALVGVVATPFYLHFLGIESYGLIGFFNTLIVLLTLLDMGLSPTMNREVARCNALGDAGEARALLRTLELVYWVAAALIGGALALAAKWIGGHWLQSVHLDRLEVTKAIMLMGLVVAVRWPVALYSGTLMGAQRLAVVSGISIPIVMIGAIGAILILAAVSPSIQAFFLWQAVVSSVHLLVLRWASWRVLGGRRGECFQAESLRKIWRFSAGLGVLTVSGIILTQFDKTLLSKMVSLDAYGRYMLASLLASGLYLLVTPVFNVLYPRFTAMLAAGETIELAELYALATRLLSTLVFSIAMAIALFAEPIVQLWTHDPVLASQVAPMLRLLILGAALHGVMFLRYALQLAFGAWKLALAINAILIAVYVPMIVILTRRYGELGAATAWLSLHIIFLCLGTWLTRRFLMKVATFGWLVRNLGIPWLAASFVALIVIRTVPSPLGIPFTGAILAALTVMAAATLSMIMSPDMRRTIFLNVSWTRRWFG